MPTDDSDKPKIDPSRLDTKVGGTRVDTMDGPKSGVTSSDIGGAGMEFGTDGTTKRTGVEAAFDPNEEADIENDLKAGDEDAPEGDAEAKPEDKAEEGAQPEELPALPEFDPENTEVTAAYEERYFTEDGKLNEAALGAVVAANMAKEGGKPELGPGEYAFLEKRLGLPKAIVDNHIHGAVALQAEKERAFNEALGGEAAVPVKLDWASKNYTPAQKDRYNKAIAEGGEAAREQIDLLNSRFEKAGGEVPKADPKADTSNRPAPPPRRAVSPQKSTATAENPGGRAGIVPFANAEEHRKAQAAAIASCDKSKIDLVRKRVAASTFWK